MTVISLIIPCYNEAQNIDLLFHHLQSVCSQLLAYDFEYIFIDDGSTDDTLSILRKLSSNHQHVHFIELSRNFGKEKAMLAGFDYASGEALIIMDADLQHPPEKIPEMISWWEKGYEDVYMVRMNRNESWIRQKLSKLFWSISQRLSDENIYPHAGDFRLLDRKCIDALTQLRENERYTKGMYGWIGFKKKKLSYEEAERVAGQSKWRLNQLVNLAVNGVLSYSTVPLRLSSYLGLFISSLAFLYLIFELGKTLFIGSDVAGYPTLIASILLLGGIQLISLGIIGEYLAKVFVETKHRPPYIVRNSSMKKSNEKRK